MSILRQRRVVGDRERAIELLKTTNLKYKEISSISGVPLGTINGLALTHRPAEVREANRRKAGTENVLAALAMRGVKSGTTEEIQKVEEVPQVQQKEDVPAQMATSPRGLMRTMIFSYEAKTDSPISKLDALTELKNIEGMMNSASGEEFTFSINIQAKEGA